MSSSSPDWRSFPLTTPLTTSLATATALVTPVRAVARVVRLPSSVRTDTADRTPSGPAWELLTAAEQVDWEGLPASPRRRAQWLAGRMAVKGAVRSLVEERIGASLHLASIEVAADELGAPYVRLLTPHRGVACPVVSIAHSDDVAVALASDDGAARGVGIDIERCRPRRALERKGLNAAERLLLADLPEPVRAQTSLRWWCAKEATAKALGTGLDLLGGARAMTCTALPEGGTLRIDVAGSSGRAPRTLFAATRLDGDYMLATVVDRR